MNLTTLLGVLLVAGGTYLSARGLPLLRLPRVESSPKLTAADFLDIVIEEQHAGQSPFGAVSIALNAAGLPRPRDPSEVTDQLAKFSPHYARLWRLLHQRGSGLLEAAVTLREGERERRLLAAEMEVKLASARSTTRLLLALPWGFLVAGQGLGLRSIAILLVSIWGYLLLALAALLTWAGRRWVESIIGSVMR